MIKHLHLKVSSLNLERCKVKIPGQIKLLTYSNRSIKFKKFKEPVIQTSEILSILFRKSKKTRIWDLMVDNVTGVNNLRMNSSWKNLLKLISIKIRYSLRGMHPRSKVQSNHMEISLTKYLKSEGKNSKKEQWILQVVGLVKELISSMIKVHWICQILLKSMDK